MKAIPAKDKSMIARMSGNIVGPLLAVIVEESAKYGAKPPDDFIEVQAAMAVGMAMAILDVIEQHIPCGKCEECKSDIRCRELPTEAE